MIGKDFSYKAQKIFIINEGKIMRVCVLIWMVVSTNINLDVCSFDPKSKMRGNSQRTTMKEINEVCTQRAWRLKYY